MSRSKKKKERNAVLSTRTEDLLSSYQVVLFSLSGFNTAKMDKTFSVRSLQGEKKGGKSVKRC